MKVWDITNNNESQEITRYYTNDLLKVMVSFAYIWLIIRIAKVARS